MDWHYTDHSDDDASNDARPINRKRSSRACDQCRKTKSKCERPAGNDLPCKSCVMAATACTFLGPSYKRGPPKGYIHAIEQRWHQVESLLGAIIQCPDSRVQDLVSALSQDDLAREIIRRVDNGPYGPSGRRSQPDGATKEDFFASILKSNESASSRDPARSCRQSRVSREIVSLTHDNGLSVLPTKKWQDNLSNQLASSSRSVVQDTPPVARRRKLDSTDSNAHYPNWDEMYTLEPEPDDVQDALDAIGGLALGENQEVRYHGKTSGLHILSRNRTDDRNIGGLWRLPLPEVWPGTSHPEKVREQDILVSLPPIYIQDRLVDLYFNYVHPMFPVLHKTRFLTEFNLRKQNSGYRHTSPDYSSDAIRPDSSQEITPLLLFAIFGITARFCEDELPPPPAGKMWEAGSNYLFSARTILARGFRQSRLSTVQSLLLLGYREFGIASMEQAWLFVGMAMRMAIDLGLNCDSSTWRIHGHGILSPTEIETRCQIWWSCCIADRYGSLYLGRPIVLKDDDFDTPLPVVNPDDDQIFWPPMPRCNLDPSYPPVAGRLSSCFRAFASLSLISGSIVTNIYTVRRVPFATRKVKYAEIERRLDQWFIGLPDQLRYDTTSRRSAIPPPHVLFLNIRYWAIVLLLNRAFVPNTTKGTESTSRNTFELKAFDLAQGAASHISSIVTTYRETFTLKRVSPFLPSSVLAAGIMHLLTLTLRPSNPQASLGLQQCMAALKDMEMVWPSATRGWELLDGVKTDSEGIFTPPPSHFPGRPKRLAEAAFGQEEEYLRLQQEGFDDQTSLNCPNAGQNGVEQLGTRIMAHMLGINIPGIEPSTSYYPGYEWWPRSYEDSPPSQEISPSPMNPRDVSPPITVLSSSSTGHLTTSVVPEWSSAAPTHYPHDFGCFSL